MLRSNSRSCAIPSTVLCHIVEVFNWFDDDAGEVSIELDSYKVGIHTS